MRGRIGSISVAIFILVGAFFGLLGNWSEEAQATFVSGTQYDGAGGPWNLTGSPYIVVGDVHVPGGKTLTIEPGVQVRFDGHFEIDVSGSLHAVGTPTSRITITSNKAVPAPGDWYRIFKVGFGGPVEISYADISYGEDAIVLWPFVNGNIISNNNISNNNNCGIYLGGLSNNAISGNNISNNHNGIYVDSSSGNNISGNIISNNDLGIYIKASLNNNITGNNLINDGILIDGDQVSQFNSHNMPSDNTVNGKPLYYHKDCSGVDIDGIPVGQLILANCTNVNAMNLQIDNAEFAIQVDYSSNTSITESNVSSNGGSGIYLYSSSNSDIENNTVSSNSLHGIYLHSSSNNSIRNNHLSSNGLDGIYLYTSSNNNIVTGNDILDNGGGIYLLVSSINNTIYHNNFNNVFSEATDSSIGNIWNDTYSQSPLRGGNYWSDWSPTCIDGMNGPNQDISGSDGICDEDYHINVNSIDYYPLKNPWVGTLPPADTTPPDAVTLAAGMVTSTSVQLQWTAVADNDSVPASGPASEYDIRHSWGGGCPLTDPGTWATAYQATGEPVPQTTGSAESFTVTGILEGTTYCFAAKVRDEVPNWSPLSNNLEVTTLTTPVDAEEPEISNVSVEPQSQTQGGSVNITADVTDNSGTVDNVQVRIVSPDGDVIGNFTMEKAVGDEYYYVFDIDTNADTGNYRFVIWAEDANGNMEESAENVFTVTPAAKPQGPDFLRDWWWLILLFVIIVVFLILLFLLRRRKGPEEAQVETTKEEPAR